MQSVLVPISVCVILPIAVVAITAAAKMNYDNKRSQVLIKSIESNCGIDSGKLAEALQKPRKSAREILNLRLLRGCIFTFIGIALCVIAVLNYMNSDSATSADSVVVPALFGAISLAIGLSYLVVYLVTRKDIKD